MLTVHLVYDVQFINASKGKHHVKHYGKATPFCFRSWLLLVLDRGEVAVEPRYRATRQDRFDRSPIWSTPRLVFTLRSVWAWDPLTRYPQHLEGMGKRESTGSHERHVLEHVEGDWSKYMICIGWGLSSWSSSCFVWIGFSLLPKQTVDVVIAVWLQINTWKV